MNKDQVEGKVKDVAGRIERQTGEWTGDKTKEVHGALKQVEGKLQNAWGSAKNAGNPKNAGRRATDKRVNRIHVPVDDSVEAEVEREIEEEVRSGRKVS
jgi:uncharacterized protein YjbJ (UPF0337 family)